ncbi:hypothetical protein BO71DRAFT_241657 [Aspergillus ellipticus CBS 707.79]|uniref:Uncharacterized protein n=1 Tax=Aspergillus ellipticus CBS 707.79 TaxID=1448320 RepID=A0A319D9P8_9EURO|nr:hypothetical protein BO71DRAFT_241657 [Aspergillus ellipticus CBS 707.79]
MDSWRVWVGWDGMGWTRRGCSRVIHPFAHSRPSGCAIPPIMRLGREIFLFYGLRRGGCSAIRVFLDPDCCFGVILITLFSVQNRCTEEMKKVETTRESE